MNKTVDGSKAVRHRFNAADVVVILLVLLCIGGAVWLFGGSGIFGSGKSVALEYEILVVDIRNDIATHITPGAEVIEGSRHYNIGKLGSAITTEPYTYEVYVDELYDENGNLVSDPSGEGERVKTEKPGYVSVRLPITATAVVQEDGYYVNGYRISVGTLIYFRLPDFAGSGYVTALTVHENGGTQNEG